MSLVYDALQKAAREKNRFAGKPMMPTPIPTPSPAPAPVALPVAPRRSPVIWIAVISLVVFAVAIAGVVFFMWKPTELPSQPTTPVSVVSSEPVTPAQVTPATAQVTPAVAPAPTPVPPTPLPANSTANDARFKLTGIMKLGEEYSAVVNGHVVTREQYVDGAIVKSVAQDRVTLNVDGREVVVRLY